MSTTNRVITLYATRGGKKKITTNVATWGELFPLIKKEGYDVDRLHATEGATKVDLVHVDAVLPAGEFTVFMRPKQTKSGAKAKRADGLNKKELTALLKEDIANFPEQGKTYYNGYSSKGIDELAGLVNAFKGKPVKAAKPAVTSKAKATPVVAKKAVTPVKKEPAKKAEPKGKTVAKTSPKKAEPKKTSVISDVDEDALLAKEMENIEKGTKGR